MEKDEGNTKDSTYLNCSYCGQEYSKTNKPVVMKCSHNLCQTCHSLNKTFLKCFICGATYKGRETKRLPINFLLLEIIEKSQSGVTEKKEKRKRRKSLKDTQNEIPVQGPSEVYRCIDCNVLFPNKYHENIYTDHTLKVEVIQEPPEQKTLLIKGLEDLMAKYQNYNENLKKYNENFFSYLIETFQNKKGDIVKELQSNDPLDNFVIFGIISKTDKERIKEFTENYLTNSNIITALSESKSFDELLIKLSAMKEIKLHHFLSSYFFYEEILNKKVNQQNIEKKMQKLKDDIAVNIENVDNASKDAKILYKLFPQDLFVEVYTGLNLEEDINKNIKLPFILSREKNLLVFDTLTESVKYYEKINSFFPAEFTTLEDFSIYVTSNYQLIVSGGKIGENLVVNNCFSVNLDTKEVNNYSNMGERRYNHSSIVVKGKYFVLGGIEDKDNKGSIISKSFEKLNLSNNTWTRLTNCPHDLKNKPILLNFEDNYIYIFDDLSHFLYYEIKHDKWIICKPTYRGSYHLQLRHFTPMVHNSNTIIMGGVNQLSEKDAEVNSNIYFLKDVGSLISVKGEFKMTDTSSKLDHGFVVDNHYIIEYSEDKHLLNIYNTKDIASYKWNFLASKEY